MNTFLESISWYFLPLFVLAILLFGLLKKVDIYQAFFQGGREGITILLDILPYLVAMMVAIEVFVVSGTMDYLLAFFRPFLKVLGIPGEVMSLGVMRTLSGTGAGAILIEIFETYGPDSLLGRMASVAFGSTESTFYIISIYFGAVKITRFRHAIYTGLLSDLAGLLASVYFVSLFFG